MKARRKYFSSVYKNYLKKVDVLAIWQYFL